MSTVFNNGTGVENGKPAQDPRGPELLRSVIEPDPTLNARAFWWVLMAANSMNCTDCGEPITDGMDKPFKICSRCEQNRNEALSAFQEGRITKDQFRWIYAAIDRKDGSAKELIDQFI